MLMRENNCMLIPQKTFPTRNVRSAQQVTVKFNEQLRLTQYQPIYFDWPLFVVFAVEQKIFSIEIVSKFLNSINSSHSSIKQLCEWCMKYGQQCSFRGNAEMVKKILWRDIIT